MSNQPQNTQSLPPNESYSLQQQIKNYVASIEEANAPEHKNYFLDYRKMPFYFDRKGQPISAHDVLQELLEFNNLNDFVISLGWMTAYLQCFSKQKIKKTWIKQMLVVFNKLHYINSKNYTDEPKEQF